MLASGINTVIDLRREAAPDCKYAQKVITNGLNYFDFATNDSMPQFNKFNTSKVHVDELKKCVQEYALKMKKFFKLMGEGHLYMACLLGLRRTDLAVTLNYLLNPVEPSSPPSLSHLFVSGETNFTNLRISAVKNLFSNLSSQDREMLGIGMNFSSVFSNRVAKLRLMNLR